MTNYYSHTLPNGLRIVHQPTISNVSYCGFIVNAGTRDEKPDEFGMAHFVEHMLFKGTSKRRAYHIINRMENVGGELNAYTNKEETVVYSIFLEEHFSRAVELLSDITFNSLFPQKEIDKEIDVIIDEIHSYEDSPSELIFDDYENMVFRDSDIGHNILGEASVLKIFNSRKAKCFINDHYVPSNIVFFSLGKTDFKKIVYNANKYLSHLPAVDYVNQRTTPIINKADHIRLNKETSQVHGIIGGISYSRNNPKRKALRVLNNILGGPGMNSRLNISLREKRGYVYNVDSSVTTYSDTGILSIYFGCDHRNVDKCIDLIYKEIKRLRQNRLTDAQLNAAKKQLIGQIGIYSDNRENIALALGKSFMYHNHIDTFEEIFSKINSVNASQIQDVANEILDEKKLFSLIYN